MRVSTASAGKCSARSSRTPVRRARLATQSKRSAERSDRRPPGPPIFCRMRQRRPSDVPHLDERRFRMVGTWSRDRARLAQTRWLCPPCRSRATGISPNVLPTGSTACRIRREILDRGLAVLDRFAIDGIADHLGERRDARIFGDEAVVPALVLRARSASVRTGPARRSGRRAARTPARFPGHRPHRLPRRVALRPSG